jgi:putative polymerase
MSAVVAQIGHRVVARQPFWLQPPIVAVLGAMLFNFFLCFVNTSVGGMGTGAVIGCEVAIILAVMFYTFPTITYPRFLVIGSAILFLIALAAARLLLGGGADIKPVRDLLIPIAFFLLGAGASDLRNADRLVRVVVTIVIVVGAFEYLFPDIFTRFFNVASFYIERGTMSATQSPGSSNLFVSGMRPEGAAGGRGLFPILGNHRVSSIFLEPVSAGNFGIVVFLWALVRSFIERKIFWGLFASAVLIIIMADSRFGANFCALCLLLAFLPAGIRMATVAALPLCSLLALVLLPDPLSAHYGIDNGFIGRIILSGRILERFDWLNWLGMKTPEFITSDSGYAYTLGGFGIVGLFAFWTMLLLVKGSGSRFYLLRDLAGAYFAVLLCISNSPFTIKTGALLWFLTGVLSRNDSPRVQKSAAVALGQRVKPLATTLDATDN